MALLIGDKVFFKKNNFEGEVIKIISAYKVRIISEEGFELTVSINDLVKIEPGTNHSDSYGFNFFIKDFETYNKKLISKKQNKKDYVIDLHIELLSSNYRNLDDFEIIQIQINECYKKIEEALESNIKKIVIIHGIGKGTLKNKVHEILINYNFRFYLSNDGGSTEIHL